MLSAGFSYNLRTQRVLIALWCQPSRDSHCDEVPYFFSNYGETRPCIATDAESRPFEHRVFVCSTSSDCFSCNCRCAAAVANCAPMRTLSLFSGFAVKASVAIRRGIANGNWASNRIAPMARRRCCAVKADSLLRCIDLSVRFSCWRLQPRLRRGKSQHNQDNFGRTRGSERDPCLRFRGASLPEPPPTACAAQQSYAPEPRIPQQ
jgi:hypothetical protein